MVTEHRGRLGAGLTARRWGARPIISAATLALTMLAVAGCGLPATPSARPAPEQSYGGLPTYLPSAAVEPDSVLVATSAQPALTVQGDTVEVQLATGTVLATVTGPEVPGEGLPYQADTTTCTWTVTLSGATAPVPITVADFSTLDHLGATTAPALVKGQPAPPKVLAPGQTVTFELRSVMTVGEGLMRWSPSGTQILASWDFEVEND